jgi:2-oxoglutarate ferredoxin oxidoreductase subunit gamma
MSKAEKMQAEKKEIVFTGFGGQGIVLIGSIVGRAAAIGDHLESTLVQSYGPESRGGFCSAQVVISATQIHYPYVRQPDILVAMSQSGFEKFSGAVKKDTLLLIDQDLVQPGDCGLESYGIPATRLAEEMGRKMIANIVMLGFFAAVSKAVSRKAAEAAVKDSVPKGTEELNLKAFTKGWDYGAATLKARDKKSAGKAGAQE